MAHQHITNDYMAHGFCFSWEPGLVWLHVASDILTGIAYYSIPLAMFYFAYKRRDLPFYRMFLLFALFILSCGTTHFFAAYTVFDPAYWQEGYVKAFTAIISAISAVLFIPMLPEAIATPSLAKALTENKELNTQLQNKVEELQSTTERLETANYGLQLSENRFRTIFDSTYEAIFIHELPSGAIIDVNQTMCKMYGYTRREVLHLTIEDLSSGIPPYTELAALGWLQKAMTGKPHSFEWQAKDRAGRLFWVELKMKLVTIGCDDRILITARDITQRKSMEDSLRRAKEAAEANARAKSLFLANMSHELRTPMTGILGMLQLALEEDLAPVSRGYLETTLSSAGSLLRILNDILDMAKIETGKLTIEEKPFSPKRCLAESVDIINPEVCRKGLDLTVSVAEEVPDTVVGDQVRLRQVLINLIGNAVKFTEGGKVVVRVTVGGMTSDGKREFTFAVKDTGIGIPDDKKELLFRAFSQVDDSHTRRYGGTGLGLAISKEIVELMGGILFFESEKGVGSTFSITIPLAEVGLESGVLSAAAAQPAEPPTHAPEGERIPRLLFAEDDPISRDVVGLMLKRSNYNLDFAEDGLRAVEMWEKGDYDIVLMDIQMPQLNGFEATRAIREKERERGGHTFILAMTAHAFKEDEERCLAAGMDAYISKPINFKKCLQVIEEIIKLKSNVVC